MPLVIMEPVKGGNLAGFSDDINDRFHQMDPEASVASFALRWVGSHPNVKVILSGMSTMQQVEDNLKTFASFKPLSEAESREIDEIVKELRSRVQNGCTGCRYCMPCPAGVNIPGNFKVWNNYHMYRTYGHVQREWEVDLKDEEKAKNCIKCGRWRPSARRSFPSGRTLRACSRSWTTGSSGKTGGGQMPLTVRMSRRQGIGFWRAWPCGRGRKYLLAVIGILLYDECN